MQSIRTLYWIILTVGMTLFATANWHVVNVYLWDGLEADVALPVLVLFAFLLGFLPTFIVYKIRLRAITVGRGAGQLKEHGGVADRDTVNELREQPTRAVEPAVRRNAGSDPPLFLGEENDGEQTKESDRVGQQPGTVGLKRSRAMADPYAQGHSRNPESVRKSAKAILGAIAFIFVVALLKEGISVDASTDLNASTDLSASTEASSFTDLPSPGPLSDDSFACTVASITDGDTLRCLEFGADGTQIRVRLSGIATRERNGSCSIGHPCPAASAIAATAELQRLASGWRLNCQRVGSTYGRVAAFCQRLDGLDLSCAMVASGTALPWDQYWDGGRC